MKPLTFAFLTLIVFLTGCCHSPYFGYPRLDRPHGNIESQKRLYSKFDPFPDPSIGPGIPEFRPADYQDPSRDKGARSQK